MKTVLDKGYVRLVDHMGSDLSVVNAARVSFDKESKVLDETDIKLINYLANHGHMSPFRHATIQFEVYAPLMVARQWWKYVVGSDHIMDAWNESSRRYVTEHNEFYVPFINEWRSAPADKKQGSGENFPSEFGFGFTAQLEQFYGYAERLYEEALKRGIAPEQARLFLPAYGLYIRWYWTTSLQGVAHFLNQRLHPHAQKEIQLYAQAVREYAEEVFPVSLPKLIN